MQHLSSLEQKTKAAQPYETLTLGHLISTQHLKAVQVRGRWGRPKQVSFPIQVWGSRTPSCTDLMQANFSFTHRTKTLLSVHTKYFHQSHPFQLDRLSWTSTKDSALNWNRLVFYHVSWMVCRRHILTNLTETRVEWTGK